MVIGLSVLDEGSLVPTCILDNNPESTVCSAISSGARLIKLCGPSSPKLHVVFSTAISRKLNSLQHGANSSHGFVALRVQCTAPKPALQALVPKSQVDPLGS